MFKLHSFGSYVPALVVPVYKKVCASICYPERNIFCIRTRVTYSCNDVVFYTRQLQSFLIFSGHSLTVYLNSWYMVAYVLKKKWHSDKQDRQCTCKSNVQARSRNDCSRGKNTLNALVIHYEQRMRRIELLSDLLVCDIFFHIIS